MREAKAVWCVASCAGANSATCTSPSASMAGTSVTGPEIATSQPVAGQQRDMDRETPCALGVASAGQCAQFGRAEDAIGHAHARHACKYYAITQEAARRAAASAWNTATVCNVRPA